MADKVKAAMTPDPEAEAAPAKSHQSQLPDKLYKSQSLMKNPEDNEKASEPKKPSGPINAL